MKRNEIPNMTPLEAMDELTLMELKKLIQKARNTQKKLDAEVRAVYQALDDMCLDLDAHTEAENASNLNEAVSCYITYGEFGLKGLLAEIREQYMNRPD